MAEGTINAYNLAEMGVNVDDAQIHKEDGELTKAQNGTTDPTGVGGGIRKRPGLLELNGSALAGSVTGGIGAPLALLASSINGTTLSGGPSRKTFWGKMARSLAPGTDSGWWTSVDGFVTIAAIAEGTPADPRALALSDGSTPNNGLGGGMPGAAAVYNNTLIYCATYTRGTDRPPIRVFDGTTDTELVRIPHNPNFTTNSTVINSLLLVGSTIYLSTSDGTAGGDGAARTGRVFALNPSTGALTLLGAQFPAGYQPYALAWYLGRLWAGTYYRSSGADLPGDISWIRPNIDAAWTLDRTMTQGRGCSMLAAYNGVLLAGCWTGTSGTTAVVEQRTSLGTWTVSLSVGSVGNGAIIPAGVTFNGNFYTVLNSSTFVATIRKFDGTTWSIVDTSSASVPRSTMWVESGVLFAGGGGANITVKLSSSPDGTTWTDLSSNFSGASALSAFACVGTLAI